MLQLSGSSPADSEELLKGCQKIADIIGVSALLEAKIRLQFADDRFHLSEFIDAVFIGIAEPQISADRVFGLVVLRSPISILFPPRMTKKTGAIIHSLLPMWNK